ncbi:MAG: hypothetical protein KC912_06815 [Proteobacteria bacterium]|nr:hypothetical protein [Pseudomonadota bacterium]
MHRRLGLASWWGLFGVTVFVGRAITRLAPIGYEAVAGGLSAVQWCILVGWCGFMLYTEGYRGFHLRFSPMVVARAETLTSDAPLWHRLLAPAYCMGWFHATRGRLIRSWGVTFAVIAVVIVVRQLPQPWRGVLDVGVVLGLSAGLLSMMWWAFVTDRPLVSPQLPA